ncbi:MAG: M13 family metallopeptidase [Muribaculaceae bacterium]|nr:M13 family metallopeptidase [Muribaculaceae bacterium]
MSSCSSSDSTESIHGVDRANLDENVKPGDDFYQYACGGWMEANPLTDEYSRYGTFDQLGELNRRQLHDLVTGLNPKDAPKGSNEQKIGDLFALGMDSVVLNAQGATPILADLEKINSVNRSDIPALMANLAGVTAFYDTEVEGDMMNSNMNTMYWGQSGLGLGDRDYYVVDGENEKKVLDAYKTYLETLAKLSGYTEEDARRLADNSIRIETEIAKTAKTREERRDPIAMYNPMSLTDLDTKYPAMGVGEFLKAQGLDNVETIVVTDPKSLATINSIIANESEQALRDYIAAGYMSSAASFLSDDFVNAEFELSKVKSGVKQLQPRWKRALDVPNSMLGEALGELYVAKYFPPSSKEKMLDLVGNLQKALGQHIDSLTWMSDETKAKAHEKLDAFTVKIGYPDKWRDYTKLDVDPSKSYWENIQNAILFNRDFSNADYGKPVDRERWYMTPQTVNAYYNPLTNEICFPAGILQAPFFDPEATDAENYGAIGVVIGHEMTHGFDDQGRMYDKDGNLSNWWTEEDAAAFTKLADGLAEQFDSIVVLGDTHANGRFTLGENIADQGGLRVSYTALHNTGVDDTEIVKGFTPDQLFYLAYANVWAGNIRDEEILRRTKTDPHSLGKWRVNATLRNIEPFFEAFSINANDPMYRPEEERVIIW